MAGLQETGKTTYLAALGLAILRKSTRQLELASYDTDRVYLNEIGGRLARCEPSPHTEVGEHRGLDLPLAIDGEELGRLVVPDLSGETWEQAVDEREWSEELDHRTNEADGVLLFVHSQGSSGPLLGELTSSLGKPPEGAVKTTFKPSLAPVDIQIIDLLQLLSRKSREKRRIALIVSAWDLVGDSISPRSWIDDNCKLLRQYLDNSEILDVQVWGVSAQGGSFTDKAILEELKPQDPVERIRVFDEEGAAGRIDDPILKLLGRQSS